MLGARASGRREDTVCASSTLYRSNGEASRARENSRKFANLHLYGNKREISSDNIGIISEILRVCIKCCVDIKPFYIYIMYIVIFIAKYVIPCYIMFYTNFI